MYAAITKKSCFAGLIHEDKTPEDGKKHTMIGARFECLTYKRENTNKLNSKFGLGLNPATGCCYGDSNPSRERERLA